MRKISALALTLALLAAPAALAGGDKCCAKAADAKCCAKGATAEAGKKCTPEDCKKSDKCTPEEKAKCAAQKEQKPEAPKAPKG
ncbi:hypothetical protein FBQ97_13475 [Acidobacteria bacterium ACD]|nr:MAG: hypothetical protein EDX89_03285 [Acidobacteriota bacterium]MDL1950807.1 hypothetical protein [Acidobacteria bacterium ACD]